MDNDIRRELVSGLGISDFAASVFFGDFFLFPSFSVLSLFFCVCVCERERERERDCHFFCLVSFFILIFSVSFLVSRHQRAAGLPRNAKARVVFRMAPQGQCA